MFFHLNEAYFLCSIEINRHDSKTFSIHPLESLYFSVIPLSTFSFSQEQTGY